MKGYPRLYREPRLIGPALLDRPVLGPSSIKVLRVPACAIALRACAVGGSSGEHQSRSSHTSCVSLGRIRARRRSRPLPSDAV
jgi:hypothetical protein